MPKIKVLPDVPEDFICPITQTIMFEPVATTDGHIYEKSAIEQWFKKSQTSPKTGLALDSKKLVPIPLIKSQILDFLQKNKICTEKEFLTAVESGDPKNVDKLNYQDKHLKYFCGNDTYFNSFLTYDDDDDDEYGPGLDLDQLAASEKGTALFIAVTKGHVKMVEYLLKNGADPNCSLSDGESALQRAISSSCPTSFFLSIHSDSDNENVTDSKTEIKPTKSKKEISPDHIAITKMLLEYGADPNYHDFTENLGYPIMMAVSSGQIEILSYLIKFKADLEVSDCFTVLHMAVAHGNLEMVKLILHHAPQLVEFTNINSETPLHTAAKNGFKEIAVLLMLEGADCKALNKDKKTPIQVALDSQKKEVAEAIQTGHESIKRLMRSGVAKQIKLEELVQKQQEEIKQLQAQLQKIVTQLNIGETPKATNSYSPKLFN